MRVPSGWRAQISDDVPSLFRGFWGLPGIREPVAQEPEGPCYVPLAPRGCLSRECSPVFSEVLVVLGLCCDAWASLLLRCVGFGCAGSLLRCVGLPLVAVCGFWLCWVFVAMRGLPSRCGVRVSPSGASLGIFLDRGSNLCPLHWREDSNPGKSSLGIIDKGHAHNGEELPARGGRLPGLLSGSFLSWRPLHPAPLALPACTCPRGFLGPGSAEFPARAAPLSP